jgi:cell fate regulator YaaT (PSP1 superfamily)
VTFRRLGKLHYYAADEFDLAVGDHVIAQTPRGPEFGEVKILRRVSGGPSDRAAPAASDNNDEPAADGEGGTLCLVRAATPDDARTSALRRDEAQSALALCQEHADRLRLPMKIVEAEIGWEGAQATFYFVADMRVDFRELVKTVARELRMRVHLHQVGSRDHAQQLGGYGPCGRPLCCTTFLRDFAPVSMKMAKDQSLFLNPSKFSGVCGKLMCCLRYEHETYLEARDRLPPLGAFVTTPDGARGVVHDLNFLSETITVVIRDDEGTRYATHPAADLVVARACGDCGSAGGGCGGGCASGSCGVPAKSGPVAGVIHLEQRWRKNWQD